MFGRQPIIVANWKMALGVDASVRLSRALRNQLTPFARRTTIVLCPSFPALASCAAALRGSRIILGGQDLFWELRGAFTGEVSPQTLREIGCRVVIVGHSERRALGETDVDIHRKLIAASHAGLTPILCVGETLAERKAGRAVAVVRQQLAAAFRGFSSRAPILVAYEPVWAIGTGVPISAPEAARMAAILRQILRRIRRSPPLLYGGSVNARNVRTFLHSQTFEGCLVGSASWSLASLVAIIRTASQSDRRPAR